MFIFNAFFFSLTHIFSCYEVPRVICRDSEWYRKLILGQAATSLFLSHARPLTAHKLRPITARKPRPLRHTSPAHFKMADFPKWRAFSKNNVFLQDVGQLGGLT